ncbi:CBO0543 family protein [Metabacillus sp. Hm71]|uniref:CBO0543 family protein n=1 Tax=Metabacillus sp. Hm71 TaxID=3450743 RepID=UPI003F420419
MHLLFVILVLYLSFKKGDWKNWETYYPTMLYISLASFLYEYISHSNFHLWELKEMHILNPMNVHFVHNLIINPLIAFVFLSLYPNKPKKQIIYFLKWVVSFLVFEWIAEKYGLLFYDNGWSFGWSAIFVITMFPMVRLHHVNKPLALILSVFFAVFYLSVFDYL